MPTTLVGLVVFVTFLVPGFVQYLQRRRRVLIGKLSPLVETATLFTTSLLTNAVVLTLFSLFRARYPDHTPDIRRILVEGSAYTYPRLGYLWAWAIGLLAASCALAAAIGSPPRAIRKLTRRFAPLIVDTTSWVQAFEEKPDDSLVFVGCELRDGTYVSGYLDWYSTELVETDDRDLMLAAPIKVKTSDGEENVDFPRVVLSAREIVRMYVSYVDQEVPPPPKKSLSQRLQFWKSEEPSDEDLHIA
jgi:hypothetical protein